MEHRTDETSLRGRWRRSSRALSLTGAAARAASARARRIRDIADQFAFRHAFDLRILLHTVIPKQRDGRHGPAGRKLELDGRALREHEAAGAFLLDALDAGRRPELQRHVGSSEDVAGHIAEGAAAEIKNPAPVERLIEVAAEIIRVAFPAFDVRPRLRGAEPEVP